MADRNEPPYTAEEKAWLKHHWGGEFKFLAAYGLSIYDEEDREEGRRIARAMMRHDGIVARNSAWYSQNTYTSFPSWLTTHIGGQMLRVVAIGDVELPVKVHLSRTGKKTHGKLRLRNVLHVPDAPCNIVGGLSTGDYAGLQLGAPRRNGMIGELTDRDGRRLAYLRNRWDLPSRDLLIIKLSGCPAGPVVEKSSLRAGTDNGIYAFWPGPERGRWADVQAAKNNRRDASTQGGGISAPYSVPPYTAEEKKWLKRHYGGEYRFLASHGLSIYKDEDREEGRVIARAMMAPDSD